MLAITTFILLVTVERMPVALIVIFWPFVEVIRYVHVPDAIVKLPLDEVVPISKTL